MTFLVIFIGLLLVLFGLVFFTKRRLGSLGLALVAGAMISNLWASNVTRLVEQAGVASVAPPLESVVAAGLILLPAFALLISGPVYQRSWQRVYAGFVFAVIALTLLVGPLDSALVIEGSGSVVYDTIFTNQAIIITIGLILSILDLMLTRTPKTHAKH